MAIGRDQFIERLVASGLFQRAELDDFFASALTDASQDAQSLARELIQAGKLTKHQATALYKGETKHLVLGNYVILDKLGEGGMGEVYRARHKVMEREVALKVLPVALFNSPDAIKRFQREVRAAAKLEHQNIVIAFDADQSAGRHFLVMQFVDGHDLSSIVKQHGPMKIEEAIDCCTQAARGLQYAHNKGVIHRDIKPSNLLLDKTGTVKILDMGLARLAGQADEGSALGGLTQSGQIMGTVDYMAPEQAEDTREADQRADIYSLGCTLYVLLTAKAPFTGQTVLQKMMAHQQKPIPKLSDARGDASLKLDAVLGRMLAKKPEERYQTMDEVIAALTSCLAPEQAHAAGALAAGSSDSHLTAFLDKLAAGDVRGRTTRVDAAGARHEETINKQPAAHADDTGTGITRPPRAQTKTSVKPESKLKASRGPTAPSADWARAKRWLLPALLVGGGLLCLLFLAAALGLFVWQRWTQDNPTEVVAADGSTTPMGSDMWLDLLPLIDTQQDAVAGTWQVKDGEFRLIQASQWPRIAVAVVPAGNYRLRVKFSGTQPGERRTVLIPVGEDAGLLSIDGGENRVSALVLKSDSEDYLKNPTRNTTFRTDPAKAQTLEVTVMRGNIDAQIVATVDGQPLFKWHGLPGDLDDSGWDMPDTRQLGFGGWTSPRVIHEAKLQMLSGQAILLRAPPVGVKLPSWAVAPSVDDGLTPYEILTSPDYEWTTPENLGPLVNSDHDDNEPTLSADGLTLLFGSSRAGTLGNHDLWMCRRVTTTSPWSAAEHLGDVINSRASEFSPALSGDGLTLLFASDRGRGTGKWRIWKAIRKTLTDRWSAPEPLGVSDLSDAAVDNEPEIAADGRLLLFTSFSRGGPLGGENIWQRTRNSIADGWSAAVELNASVNTDARDFGPTLSSDGRVLIFASDRSGGQGGLDFWMATRTASDAPWSAAVPLSAPLNSAGDEISPALSPDGRSLLFRSHRGGGLGGGDLWMSRRVRKASSPANVSGAPKLVLRKKLTGHAFAVNSVAFNPAGGTLASGAGGWSGELFLWNVASGEKIGQFKGHTRNIDSLAFSADGQRLLSVGVSEALKEWDVSQRTLLTSADGRYDVVAFSHNGKLLATGGDGNERALRDPRTLATKTPLAAYANLVRVSFSHDGKWLATTEGNRLDIHDLSTGKRIRSDVWNGFLDIAYAHDDKLLAVCGEKFAGVKLLDAIDPQTGLPERGMLVVGARVMEMVWLPGSRYLVLAVQDASDLQLWDTQKQTLIARLPGHTKRINAIALSPDGRTLATASEDHDVILWDVNRAFDVAAPTLPKLSAHLRKTLPGSAAGRVVVSPDGKLLAARHRGAKKIKVWNAETGAQTNSFDTTLDVASVLAFLPNPELEKLPGGAMLAAGEEHGLGLFELPRGTRTLTDISHKGHVAWIAGSRGNEYIATAGGMGDAAICLWTLQGKVGKTTIGRHGENASNWASAVAFNADDTRLASGGNDGKVHIYELPGGKEIKTLDVGREVHCVAFSPDGRLLASGDRTPCVKLWQVATGALVKTLTDFDKDLVVDEVAFSPDGRLLAAAKKLGRGPLRVFDLALGGEPLVMTAAPAYSVAFMPTGHTLVTADEATGVQLWDLDVPEIETTTATFTAPDQAQGLKPVGTDGRAFKVEEVQGKSAIRIVEFADLHFTLDDAVAFDLPADSADRIIVRATMLDEKSADVTVSYDSHAPNNGPSAQELKPAVHLNGSGKWVDLEWELPNARLANKMGFAADLALVSYGFRVAIHKITLERIRGKPRADFTNALGMEFVRVPAGKSWLGGGGGKPGTREIEFQDDFYLGKYEITQDEWEKVMDGDRPSYFQRGGTGSEAVKSVSDADLQRFPVEAVSWEDAQEFVRRLNAKTSESGWAYRLPTKDEAEYACRGGALAKPEDSAFDFYFAQPANVLRSEQANVKESEVKRPRPVGSYAPNRLDLHDMHGNVREWCADARTGTDGSDRRVARFGGWSTSAVDCRADKDTGELIPTKYSDLGLRVVRVRSTEFTSALGMQFIRIPAGKSWLGGGGGKLGKNAVEVEDDFYLGTYEVTQQQWFDVMATRPSFFTRTGGGRDLIKDVADDNLPNFPVEQVSWDDCRAFIAKLNEKVKEQGWVYRLPTVGEWEYACRNGPMTDVSQSSFSYYFDQPTNELLPAAANVSGEGGLNRTAKVGSYRPNRLGLYDMHGNVWEWCDDSWETGLHSHRGGCFSMVPAVAGAYSPSSQKATWTSQSLGLRVARVPVAGAWQQLLNGKDMTGWKYTSTSTQGAQVAVEDGQPVLQLTSGAYVTPPALGDYHLRFDYTSDPDAKGGVHLFGSGNGRIELGFNGLRPPYMGGFGFTYQMAEVQAGRLVGSCISLGDKIEKTYQSFSQARVDAASSWQHVDVYRLADSFVFLVNGQMAGALANVRDLRANDARIPGLSNITFWATGGPMTFRNVEVREINALPPEILELAAWQPLFNGKDLTGWKSWVSPLDSTVATPAAIVEHDGRPALAFKGQEGKWHAGVDFGVRSNYRLRLQYKWDAAAKSGIAAVRYHHYSPGFCHFNLATRDRVGLSGSQSCVLKYRVDEAAIIDGKIEPQARLLDKVKPASDPQRKSGEWNDLELICLGDDAIHLINGQVVCVTTNAREVSTSAEKPVVGGALSLIGYHGTMYLRDIRLRPINELPLEVMATALRQPLPNGKN